MGSLSAERMLHLPVHLHGILLGRSADLLLDPAAWRAVGFDIVCGDGASRFLPFTTTTIREDEIVVDSALMLLEDVDFYLSRGTSFRSLGLEEEDAVLRIGPDGAHIVSSQAAA
jgi:hypothetical protein